MFPMTALPRLTKIAGGNIRPARIITTNGNNAEQAIEATGATAPILGVAVNATKYPPGTLEDNGFSSMTGDAVQYHGQGEIAFVMAGAAITSLTTPLTSDNQGRAISATIAGNTSTWTYTIGLPNKPAAAAGELITVQIDLRAFPPVA